MRSWFLGFIRPRSQKKGSRIAASVRPRLEALEDRLTPTLTPHAGAVLANVQAQAVYLGAGWSSSTIAPSVFDAFLGTIVTGTKTAPAPYLGMLVQGGFAGVTGAGDALQGYTDATTVPSTITDAQIQADLQIDIADGKVQSPTSPNVNPLYVVFVQPGTVVSIGNGETSVNTFLAYHSSFLDGGVSVPYAVVPFHGTAGNAQDPWLNQQDSMTVAASHELAEAVTDPTGAGYFDRSHNEVGDVVNGSTVYLKGYAVQREGSLPASLYNFLPLTPTGAVASHSDTFTIQGGALAVNGVAAANPAGETGTVAAVSQPSIDDFGQPLVDVVFSDHQAYEYHDFPAGNPTAVANPSFFPWTSLGGNVKQAAAGQGVSYVLLTNGALGEYVDPNYSTYYYGYGVNPGARYGAIATGVTTINGVGLDQEGGNAVAYTAVVRGKTGNYEWRDVTAKANLTTSGNPFGATTTKSSPVAATTTKSNPVAATTTTSNPVSGTKHSEVSTTMGAASGVTPTTLVVLDVPPPSAPFLAPSGATVQQSQAASVNLAPAVVSIPTGSVHAALADGGGGSSGELPQEEAASQPAAPGETSLLGAAFTEAVRRLTAPFTTPPGYWPAAPMGPAAPPSPASPGSQPAPMKGSQPAAPGKGMGAIPLEKIGLVAVPAAVGLCGAGLEREERRRRERLLEKSR